MALTLARAFTPKPFYSGSQVCAARVRGPWPGCGEGADLTGQPLRPDASAEKRYRGLLDRRDMEANLADEAREERDMLQTRRRELIDASRAARAKRDELSDEARIHEELARAARVRLQGSARKKQQRGGNKGPETEEEKHDRLRAEIAQAERRLEREPMPIAEEKKLVEVTRRKKREADSLKAALAAKAPAGAEGLGDDLPHDEEGLKHVIDEQSAQANALRGQAQAAHDEAQKHSGDIDALTKEADIKHARVLDHRAKANDIHEKAMKMRELVIAERAKRQAEREEGRQEMADQAERVKSTLFDEERTNREADEAVATLKAKGRLAL